MATIAGTTAAAKVAQVHENQSAAKVSKQNSNKNGGDPQDKVTISSQARAAQQASQSQQNGADTGKK